jgi:hypothetical protein
MEENVEQGLSQQEPQEDSALQTPQGDQAHPPVSETEEPIKESPEEVAAREAREAEETERQVEHQRQFEAEQEEARAQAQQEQENDQSDEEE